MLQYRPALAAAGIDVEFHELLGDSYVAGLSYGARASKLPILGSYARRLRQILSAGGYDVIWVYAELFPYLPGFMERLAFITGKPVVYDLDDAFFHPYDNHPSAFVRSMLGGKLEGLVGKATICCCGNAYLQDYAQRFNKRTMILPTVVDTDVYRPGSGSRNGGPPVIGWIGSPSTWCNLVPIVPVLEELRASGAARIRIIGAGSAAEQEAPPGFEMRRWSEDSEVDDVRGMDIGIMPLLDQPFQRGKSGYKLIQYMACGLPVIASPVGVNGEIVQDGHSGYLASTSDEWRSALAALLRDPFLRQDMGERGRKRAEADYSLKTHAPRLVGVFRSLHPPS